MRKLFYGMIAIFIVISAVGMILSGLYLYRVTKEMELLVDGTKSLVDRSRLGADVTAMNNVYRKFPAASRQIRIAAANIKSSFAVCENCHHDTGAGRKIEEIGNIIRAIETYRENEERFEALLEKLDILTHNALVSGQILVAGRSKNALNNTRMAWIIFIVNLIMGMGVIIAASIFFLRRFEKSINTIIGATDAVRRGERISGGSFVDEFRRIGEALEMMQSELLIKEEKLLNWAKQWQTAFNAVDEMMALCNTEGQVIISNEAFYRIFGKEVEIYRKSLHEIVCRHYKSLDLCPFSRTLKEGAVYTDTIQHDNMFISIKTYPVLSDSGEINGALWIGRDITKERELEERAIQSEKLVALGELVAGIAHEINNPLTSVVGFSEILKGVENIGEEDRQRIEKIHSAAIRASKIIKNLLEFSRKKPTEFKTHNLTAIVEKVIELKEYELRVDGIRVRKNFSDIPEVWCDMTQIQQILLNLINNAHHAIDEKGGGGIITIKTYSDGENAYLEVSDTGAGMSDDIMNRIFEPFFTTKDVGKGTGLGLSIVFSAVRSHGGEVKVDSAEGEGASITVSIPLGLPPRS